MSIFKMMRKKKIVFKMVSVFSFQARTQKMNAAIERLTDHKKIAVWVLRDNNKAIHFYERYGFQMTADKKFEEDTTEYLVRLER